MCPFNTRALSSIYFTTPHLKPIHAAAPPIQIPAHFSQGMEYSVKKLFKHCKISSPFVCNFNTLENNNLLIQEHC